MKIKTAVIGVMVLFVASYAMADPISIPGTVTLVSTDGPTVDGVIIPPYNITFNGQNYLAFCDDFQDEISVGQSWAADEYQGYGLIYPKFAADVYGPEFWLASQETPANQIPTELAMWAETDPTFPYSTATSVELLTEALANTASVNYSNFVVFTPIGDGQELFGFVIPNVSGAPEPGTWIMGLLGVGMVGIGKFTRRFPSRQQWQPKR